MQVKRVETRSHNHYKYLSTRKLPWRKPYYRTYCHSGWCDAQGPGTLIYIQKADCKYYVNHCHHLSVLLIKIPRVLQVYFVPTKRGYTDRDNTRYEVDHIHHQRSALGSILSEVHSRSRSATKQSSSPCPRSTRGAKGGL